MSEPDWLGSEWNAMGEPVSERPSALLDAWYRSADEYVPKLAEAARLGNWDVVEDIAGRLRGVPRGAFGNVVAAALSPVTNIASWISMLTKMRNTISGTGTGDEVGHGEAMAVESVIELFESGDFSYLEHEYSTHMMDSDANAAITAFIDAYLKKRDLVDDTPRITTFKQFADMFTKDDIRAVDRALHIANTAAVREQSIVEINFGGFVHDMAVKYANAMRMEAARMAPMRFNKKVVDQWRDALRTLWALLGPAGRLDIFLNIDYENVPRHPRLSGVAVPPTSVTPGTQIYATVWEDAMITLAKGMFEKGTFVEDERMRTVFSARRANGPRLKMEQSLAIASDQSVYLASEESGAKWVVKWALDVKGEESNWLQLRAAGGATPDILQGYNVFGLRVLVVERLFPLDHTDDEYEIGKQLLTNQFPFLHTFAVHADIKPDNIMKRVYVGTPTRVPDYFIIDMDVEEDRIGEGFDRNHSTPLYNSVGSEAWFPTTWRDDILEFLYTLNALGLHRQFISEPKVGVYGPDKLNLVYIAGGAYKNLPPRSVEKRLLESDRYTDPITLWPEPNTVMWSIVEKQLKALSNGSVAMGVRDAFSILALSPHAHPDDPVHFKWYEDLAAAFDHTDRQRARDVRRHFMPVSVATTAGPFAGAHVCWTCARTPKKLQTAEMFRENEGMQRVFCGKRCQEVFHETPKNCERM